MIAQWFAFSDQAQMFPDTLPVTIKREAELRYGENPHQKAALYLPLGPACPWHRASRAGTGQGTEL